MHARAELRSSDRPSVIITVGPFAHDSHELSVKASQLSSLELDLGSNPGDVMIFCNWTTYDFLIRCMERMFVFSRGRLGEYPATCILQR